MVGFFTSFFFASTFFASALAAFLSFVALLSYSKLNFAPSNYRI